LADVSLSFSLWIVKKRKLYQVVFVLLSGGQVDAITGLTKKIFPKGSG